MKALPLADMEDAFDYTDIRRQFAPEYSHECYLNMLQREQAIGDYIDLEGLPSTIIDKESRSVLLQLIKSIH